MIGKCLGFRFKCSGLFVSNALNAFSAGLALWQLLPIHKACELSPTVELVNSLIHAYPECVVPISSATTSFGVFEAILSEINRTILVSLNINLQLNQ